MASMRNIPSYNVANDGYILPGSFPLESYYSGLKYPAEDGDIFISTYPKCGTTWCQYILFLLWNDGKPIEEGQSIHDFAPHLEEKGAEFVMKMAKPRIIKIHLPFYLTPYNSKSKYIYIARNPKDCCVSFYHHTRGFPKHYNFQNGTFDDYFELFITGQVDSGDYFDNLLSWYSHKDDDNILFLLYEDIKSDPESNIRKIGYFLEGKFASSVDNNDILEKVVKNSHISAMKATHKTAWSSERPKNMPDFLRKGEVGDWKNYMSEDQTRRMDERFREKLGKSEARYLWKEYDI
ncbi:sulfotransferase ssu-1-like [Centruroides vittatus]|uniref:sulfotransferase ssu-1-like n=1 Tax=Centruroides vittatus TaxID=120091 RepID=UPI00350EC490